MSAGSRGVEVAGFAHEAKTQTSELKQINKGIRLLRHEQTGRAKKAVAATKKAKQVKPATSRGNKP